MSSSEHFPNWGAFTERVVPLEVSDLLAPASEVGALIQYHETLLTRERQEAASVQHTLLRGLARQAVLAFQLEAMLRSKEAMLTEKELAGVYRSLRIQKDQMLDA